MAGVERKKPGTQYLELAMWTASVDSAFLRRDHRTDCALSVTPTHELSTLYDLRGLVRTSAD